jgi:Zn-dependent peptidase ImmA (M78 family)
MQQPTSVKSDLLIDSSTYYREMQALALAKRAVHKVETALLDLRFMQKIYKAEKIKIDYWDFKSRKIRAAYFCEENDYSVVLNKKLPRVPKLFSLAHELKHHYIDQQLIQNRQIKCGDYNVAKTIEIGAEVFAAEFIYSENEMRALAESMGINALMCSPEKIVEFKRSCPAHISFTFILKRFERFGFILAGKYNKIKFQKLEEQIYGIPIYKQEWFKKYRAKKRMFSTSV